MKTDKKHERQLSPGEWYWPLWKHMSDNHGLILLDSECDDIIRAAEKVFDGEARSILRELASEGALGCHCRTCKLAQQAKEVLGKMEK